MKYIDHQKQVENQQKIMPHKMLKRLLEQLFQGLLMMLSLINMTTSWFEQLRVAAVIVRKVKPYISVQNVIQDYVQ
jgi:hypothetical protein